ncbi:MAG: TonB-dependent receptor [Bacteroidetes bacterium]|nr:TonB-dependent receptor [Bacteroidota bacterium]
MKYIAVTLCVLFPFLLQAQDSTTTRSQTVRGTVLDAVSNAPLQGVTVAVMEGEKATQGAITDKTGSFKIKNVRLGRRVLRITAIGYEPYINDNVLVTAGKEVVLNVQLTERYSSTGEVAVVYDRSNDDAITNNEFTTVSARAFNLEDTKRYAGALGDPSRMAQNFAGVVGANDARNDIVVRGNSPSGMLWQLEGMNIPNPNHFGSLSSTGGPVSMLNNNVLDKSDFMTSAFPSMYGNAISGAFDLRMRDGNSEKYEFLGQIGFNGFEGGAEGPMWEGSSFLVNYRYSTLGVFKTLGINFGTGNAVPDYQDLNFKLKTKIGEHGTLTWLGTGGASSVVLLGTEMDTTKTDLYGQQNRNQYAKYKTGWTGLSYDDVLGENTFFKAMIGASATKEDYIGDSLAPVTRAVLPDQEANFTTVKLTALSNIRHKFDARTSLTAGFIVDRSTFDLYNRDNIGTPSERVYVDIKDNATLSQVYAQLKMRLTEDLTVNGGLHAQHYTYGNALAVEPRVGITASLSPTMSINVGYGLHSQAQNVYVYNVQTEQADGSVTFTNRDLGFTKSHHAVLGYDWFMSDDIRLRLEGYYQSLFDIPVERMASTYSAVNTGSDFGPTNKADLVNNGTGHNVGVELTLEHFFRNGFYFLLTSSLFDSRYKGSDGVERNTAYNTNYVVNALVGKEFRVSERGVFAANVKFSTTGGRYLTPIDLAASQEAGYAIYDNANAYSQRQSAYLRFDVKLSYRVELGASTMEFAIDLQNVTNHKNVFSQQYDPRTGTVVTQYQQGFFPVPTFRYTF